MKSLESYQTIINTSLHEWLSRPEFDEPSGLYEPCKYILHNGGKRIRASLVLMASKMFSKTYDNAVPVALAFETFHNFTLIHDDIMDNAPIRRGVPTVHVKWNENTAILSGDAVMIIAYRFFEHAGTYVPRLFHLLNQTALEVCEGQQYDVDLECAALTDAIVTEDMYLKMIELKTSVLIAACLKAGSLVGGANDADADRMYEIGRLIGVAFQLQDDILDTYGNQATFGKKIGGDIRVNKKTYLLIKALKRLGADDAARLASLMSVTGGDEDAKFNEVRALYDKAAVREETIAYIEQCFDTAVQLVGELSVDEAAKKELLSFMNELLHRDY